MLLIHKLLIYKHVYGLLYTLFHYCDMQIFHPDSFSLAANKDNDTICLVFSPFS